MIELRKENRLSSLCYPLVVPSAVIDSPAGQCYSEV